MDRKRNRTTAENEMIRSEPYHGGNAEEIGGFGSGTDAAEESNRIG